MNLFEGDKAKNAELEKVVKAMPLISVEAEAFTEGEDKMTATDAITLKFTLKYDNLEEKETPGYVHSAKFPFLKRQNWTLIFVDGKTKETIIAIEKLLPKEGNSATFELKQRFGQVGKFTFYVYFKNDSYLGFDKELPFEFEIVADDKNRVIPPVMQEDIDAVKGPSMVQSMLDQKPEDESESDEENENEFESLKDKLRKAGLGSAVEAKGKKVESELM